MESTMATRAQRMPHRMTEPRGTPAAFASKSAICEEMVAVCAKAYGARLRAIVLAGSLARNEGTFIARDGCSVLLGDADVFLVFRDNAGVPAAAEVTSLGKSIEARLAERGIRGTIGVDAVSARYLQVLAPRILSYEIRQTSQVLWGDKNVLSLIPDFSPAEISREDAWRMLCNRMIEQLDFVNESAIDTERLNPALQYAVIKLYLDLATSYLLFAGAYEPTYRVREKRLRELAGLPSHGSQPFPLNPFSARVSECTEQKLSGELNGNWGSSSWQEAISYAIQLWRWEAVLLTSEPNEFSTAQLCQSMAKRLTNAQKLRGWFSVARRAGWWKSWRRWPGWARMSFQTSPRYGVYQAAILLAEQLCAVAQNGAGETVSAVDLQEFNRLLPVPAIPKDETKLSWTELAKAIVLNYQRFLTGTTT